ncbi:MAG TPA: MFS transporter [Nitrolancea sp.]|nr:MFS transporter [Nitrolancea sp.]
MTSDEQRSEADQSPTDTGSRLAVLGYRDFRLLWGGELVSTIGTQMQLFAVTWQVLQLLRRHTYSLSLAGHRVNMQADALGLGALGLARVLPVLVLALLGGALADAHDRRTVITIAQAGAATNAGMLALLSITGHAGIGALYLLSAVGVATSVFAQPAQQALVPSLVKREHLTNAYSLYALIWQVGTLIGPPLAGIIIAMSGFGTIYALDAASFIAVLLAVRAMRYQPGVTERRTVTHWSAIREGLRFAHGTSLIWQTLLIDLYATFFASARAMVPLIATNVLHVGVRGYGFLASAQAVGAFIAGLLLTLRRDIQRQGIVLFASVAAFGLAWALFGLVNIFVLAYLLYSLTGATDTVSYVIRTTLRQSLTPNEMRGRVAGIHMTLGDAGPALGELESGIVASLFSAPIAIVTGGLATFFLTLWAARRWNDLRNYRSSGASNSQHVDHAELGHVP